MLSIIVAKAKNNVIGNNNSLIWHIPEDLKRFKAITTGHTVIMGKRTYESIGRPLPNRKNIVLAGKDEVVENSDGIEIINSIDEIKKYVEADEECFIIGGAMVYKQLMPYCEKMYITEIDKEFEGDVTFPQIDKKEWKITNKIKGNECETVGLEYYFVDYEKA